MPFKHNSHKDDDFKSHFNTDIQINLTPRHPTCRYNNPHLTISSILNSFNRLLSNLFFLWVLPVLYLGKKSSLKIKSLPQITPIDLSRSFFQELHHQWSKTTSSSSYPLFKAVYLANYHSIVFIIILSCLKTSLYVARVFIFRQTLLTFQPKPTESPMFSTGITLFLFLAIRLLLIIISRKTISKTEIQGAKTTIQINSLLYDKLLKVTTFNKATISEGELINYIQLDSEKFAEFITNAHQVIFCPFQLCFYIVLLFQFFGPSFIVGMLIQVCIIGLLFLCEKKKDCLQKELMSLKDERMKTTTQAFSMIKLIKLYSWEDYFTNLLHVKRQMELQKMRQIEQLKLFIHSTYLSFPIILSVISIALHNLLYDSMDISNILTAIYIFNSMTELLGIIPEFITNLFEMIISMRRIENFLRGNNYDIGQLYNLDDFSDISIRISHCDFGIRMPNKKDNITLLHDITFDIYKGETIGIFGSVGSGKTCLLNAILNNLDLINKKTLCNIKTRGNISLISQEPWILNDTLRNNILFDKEMNEEKYYTIIRLCELDKDIQMLNGGDLIEIGEKGVNLSGGQKARIAIARALYSDASIYLFDDPLSALDANVGRKIFDNVIMGYLKDKTKIVVTHAMQYYSSFDKVMFIKNGTIDWFDKVNDLNSQMLNQALEIKESINNTKKIVKESIKQMNVSNKKTKIKINTNDKKDIELTIVNNDKKKNDEYEEKTPLTIEHNSESIRITKDEHQKEGTINSQIWITYFSYAGGIRYLFLLIIGNILWKFFELSSDYYLSYWTLKKSLTHNQNMYYLLIFSIINLLSTFTLFLRSHLSVNGVVLYSKKMHEKLISKLFKAPINLFHDTIPRSHILNRLSKDLDKSTKLFNSFNSLFRVLFQLCSCIFICVMYNWSSLFFIPILIMIDLFILNYYRKTAIDLNRLEGVVRSPIISVFSETIPGVSIIRAFNYQETFRNKFFKCLNDFYKVRLYQSGCRHWLGTTLHLLSFCLMVLILLFVLMFKDTFSPQAIGLLLTYSIKLTDYLYSFLSKLLKLEAEITSVERCHSFTEIPQEKKYINDLDNSLKIDNYPNEGKIEFHNLSLQYRPNTPLVIKGMNIKINPREKIGVVGRTGSGKSTLCLALFRIIEASKGKILIDNINIASIGLRLLRKSITIIPQEPSLLEGTLRENLDPLGDYSDSEIIGALKKIGLEHLLLIKGLEMIIEENGNNLSIGEKQLICIARAILHKSIIVIMDEATSNIDYKNEEMIQKVINDSLKNATVITIAHRIKTILHYDKIMVLNNGIVEDFDSPFQLIKEQRGIFYELYTQSVLKDS